jgi:hypothetical protein
MRIEDDRAEVVPLEHFGWFEGFAHPMTRELRPMSLLTLGTALAAWLRRTEVKNAKAVNIIPGSHK